MKCGGAIRVVFERMIKLFPLDEGEKQSFSS
jgi:hypothetical protein